MKRIDQNILKVWKDWLDIDYPSVVQSKRHLATTILGINSDHEDYSMNKLCFNDLALLLSEAICSESRITKPFLIMLWQYASPSDPVLEESDFGLFAVASKVFAYTDHNDIGNYKDLIERCFGGEAVGWCGPIPPLKDGAATFQALVHSVSCSNIRFGVYNQGYGATIDRFVDKKSLNQQQ